MSFHIKRSITAQNDTLSVFNGARLTRWERPKDGRSVCEIQTVPDPSALQNVPSDKLNPPYHWHWYQEELFTVLKGRYIFTLEGHEITISPSSPQPVRIPPRARHTFRADTTCPTACEIRIETSVSPSSPASKPEEDGISERFFRNLYSYLDDCESQGVAPSLPQLLLFLHSAEVSLAFAWGPAWVMRWVSYALGLVVGKGVGEYLLGYRGSYGEYYDGGSGSKEARKGK